MNNHDDVHELRADETSRGKRRPTQPLARRAEKELLRSFRKALLLETENEFLEAMQQIEPDGDPVKLKRALAIWRAFRRGG